MFLFYLLVCSSSKRQDEDRRHLAKVAEEDLFINPNFSLSPSLSLFTHTQVSRHERRISQIEQLNQMPLYPTEKIIWDENIVPTEYYSGEGVCRELSLGFQVCLCVCAS